jgi:short-subunit dehydrogenase
MTFEKLANLVLTQRRQSSMLELFEEAATKTEIQTQVSGNWVHDAYDSDKPLNA